MAARGRRQDLAVWRRSGLKTLSAASSFACRAARVIWNTGGCWRSASDTPTGRPVTAGVRSRPRRLRAAVAGGGLTGSTQPGWHARSRLRCAVCSRNSAARERRMYTGVSSGLGSGWRDSGSMAAPLPRLRCRSMAARSYTCAGRVRARPSAQPRRRTATTAQCRATAVPAAARFSSRDAARQTWPAALITGSRKTSCVMGHIKSCGVLNSASSSACPTLLLGQPARTSGGSGGKGKEKDGARSKSSMLLFPN